VSALVQQAVLVTTSLPQQHRALLNTCLLLAVVVVALNTAVGVAVVGI
jgi:dihydrodipicolinate reductase